MLGIVLWDTMLIALWIVGSVLCDAILALPFALDAIGPESTFEAILQFILAIVWLGAVPVGLLFLVVIPSWNKGF